MFQNKKQIKITILLLLILIVISQFSLFPFAKTEVYFSLSDNPQKEIIKNINQAEVSINIAMYIFTDPEIIEIFQNQFINLWTNKYSLKRTWQLYEITKVNFLPASPAPAGAETKVININTASQEEFIKILKISQPLAQKIITLRDSLSGGFKDPQDLLQLPELTTLDLLEWRGKKIIITVD